MAVEVLLRRTIEGVGGVGEVVRVKNGYARNYLLPKGYAALGCADAMARIEQDKGVEAKRQSELAEYHTALVEKLKDLTLTLEVRAGEDGHLYGSVTTRHVLGALEAEGYKFIERQVRFETVRELGEYVVPVHLSGDHQVDVKLWVVQDAQDIEEMAAASAAAAEAEAEDGGSEGDESSEAPEAEAATESAAE